MGIQGLGAKGAKADLEVAQAEAPKFARVNWWRDGNRKSWQHHDDTAC